MLEHVRLVGALAIKRHPGAIIVGKYVPEILDRQRSGHVAMVAVPGKERQPGQDPQARYATNSGMLVLLIIGLSPSKMVRGAN